MMQTMFVDSSPSVTLVGDSPTPVPRTPVQQQQHRFVLNMSQRPTSQSKSKSQSQSQSKPKPAVPPKPNQATRQLTCPTPWPKPRQAQSASAPEEAAVLRTATPPVSTLEDTTALQAPLLKPKTRRAPEPTRAMRFKRLCATRVLPRLQRAGTAVGHACQSLRGGMSRLLDRLRPRQA